MVRGPLTGQAPCAASSVSLLSPPTRAMPGMRWRRLGPGCAQRCSPTRRQSACWMRCSAWRRHVEPAAPKSCVTVAPAAKAGLISTPLLIALCVTICPSEHRWLRFAMLRPGPSLLLRAPTARLRQAPAGHLFPSQSSSSASCPTDAFLVRPAPPLGCHPLPCATS